MLPLKLLLNPSPPDQSTRQADQVPASSVHRPSSRSNVPLSRGEASSRPARQQLNTINYSKSRPRGPIVFPPYEKLDQDAMREISRFRVSPFGQIRQCCEHIPYNSNKKDFYEKTGRESIEVFKYEFWPPGSEHEYTVMWDYNVGLVRMTPFFKCLGYQKTKPSQMLDKNPGLRDISPSVTGGSVSAQGYWMPYTCARAICATFCHEIAGALIPLFGPGFPSECTRPESPAFKDMVISKALITEAARASAASRRTHMHRAQPSPPSSSSQVVPQPRPIRRPIDDLQPSSFQPVRSRPSWRSIIATDGTPSSPPSSSFCRPPEQPSSSSISFTPLNAPTSPGSRLGSPLDASQRRPKRSSTDTWTGKRRRTDASPDQPPPDPSSSTTAEGEQRAAAPQTQDYNAAVVLVSLQMETQGLTSPSPACPAVEGRDAPPASTQADDQGQGQGQDDRARASRSQSL